MNSRQAATTIPKQNGEAREFHFTAQDFERVRKLIYDYAGISLNPHKQDMVYSRLARRLRMTGLNSFGEYLALVESGDPAEWEAFTNALTTNLTSFFREQHHFPLLAEHIQKVKGRHPITVWCAAASTGEEPYSIAITLAEALNGMRHTAKIIASDLDTHVLEKASSGVYAMDRIEKIAPDKVRKFFMKGSGSNEGYVRVRQELRDVINFRQINLLDTEWPLRGPFDVIFCRNVMIYFDRDTQYKILERFAPLLQPDGLLFAGHSESFNHAADLFQPCGKTVYRLATSKVKSRN